MNCLGCQSQSEVEILPFLKILMTASETALAVTEGRGTASGHLDAMQMAVSMCSICRQWTHYIYGYYLKGFSYLEHSHISFYLTGSSRFLT